MGVFTDALDLRYIDGRDYEVIDPFDYLDGRWSISVPRGFITDFASVPRFFWRVLPPTGLYGKAAVIHDYLYRIDAEVWYRLPHGPRHLRPFRADEALGRAGADRTFYSAMKGLGVGVITRWVMWLAVRLFGGLAYRRKLVACRKIH